MADCHICLEELFTLGEPSGRALSSHTPLPDLDVVSFACGAVVHKVCADKWLATFRDDKKWVCAHCRMDQPRRPQKLFFAGQPYAAARAVEDSNNRGGGLKGKARALETRVAGLGIETGGKEMQRVLGSGGVADLIKEMSRYRDDEWASCKDDGELRSSLTSLTSSLTSLLPKLHYTYKTSSLQEKTTELEASIATHQSALQVKDDEHKKEIVKLGDQALDKLNKERANAKERRKRDRDKTQEDETRLKIEMKSLELQAERLIREKKELASQVARLEASDLDRRGIMDRQKADYNKLRLKYTTQKDTINRLETGNSTLQFQIDNAKAETSRRKRARLDLDDSYDKDEGVGDDSWDSAGMDEDEVEDPDESLVVDGGDESWMSEKAPAISTSSYRSSSKSSSALRTTINVNRSAFNPSVINTSTLTKRSTPSSDFSSGPRSGTTAPAKPAPSDASRMLSAGVVASSMLALGRKVSRR